MKPFTTFTSICVPLSLKDVDTDMIIPAEYLKSTEKTGFGDHLFKRLREGQTFCLNDSRYTDASILIAGSNFGCGSSREHAVWALQGWGFKAIIAPSFADIFAGNCAKNGLLLISLPHRDVQSMQQKASMSAYSLTIDLQEESIVTSDNEVFHFNTDPFTRERFLQGIDEFDYILSKKQMTQKYFSESKIQAFQCPMTQE